MQAMPAPQCSADEIWCTIGRKEYAFRDQPDLFFRLNKEELIAWLAADVLGELRPIARTKRDRVRRTIVIGVGATALVAVLAAMVLMQIAARQIDPANLVLAPSTGLPAYRRIGTADVVPAPAQDSSQVQARVASIVGRFTLEKLEAHTAIRDDQLSKACVPVAPALAGSYEQIVSITANPNSLGLIKAGDCIRLSLTPRQPVVFRPEPLMLDNVTVLSVTRSGEATSVLIALVVGPADDRKVGLLSASDVLLISPSP
jgi:hypothetical protein